ncbi:MAG: hypothetical protein ABEK17_00390, partial [Candidatus Aenigmatarchaeota archaeon]
ASGPFFSVLASSLTMKLPEKLSRLPEYYSKKLNLRVKNKKDLMKKLEKWINNNFEIISDIDGIKFEVNGSHVLVRTSGTEDLIRINAESKNRDIADETVKMIKDYINSC